MTAHVVDKIPNWRGSFHFDKITGQHSHPQFHLPPLGSLTDMEAPGGESGNV